MALAEDQRAMLQLLLEGGQSYADIGSLLGIDASEVRTRARHALTEIGGADPDAEVGLTDYLLGQADPIGRADAARHLQSDPAAAALAARLAAQLRLLAPNARLPELPGASASPQPGAASHVLPAVGAPGGPSAPGAGRAGGTGARAAGAARGAIERIGSAFAALGARERRLPVALGAGALLVVLVVLLATGTLFGGSDSADSSTSADTSTNGTAGDVTVVQLQPQDGGSAGGQATFARIQDQPVLQLNLFGLKPTSKDDSYIVWLYNSDDVAFPLARDVVGKDGNLTGAAAIPSSLIPLLPQFQQVDVSLASNTETANALKSASTNQQLPKHSGTS
ncbi:MAG: hypothetical protein ABR536_02905, partial [Solirubrobacterales bacterium]